MHNFIRCLLRAHVCASMLCFAFSPLIRADEGAAELNWNPSAVADRSKDTIEAVMEHHIDPPTRQQLVLEVLRAVAEATHQRLPSEMSSRISMLGDPDTLYALLNDEVVRLGLKGQSSEWMNAAVLKRLNHVVPGGVRIVLQRDYAVDEQLAANRYVGIGVQASMDRVTKRMNFSSVIEGGSAYAAGLRPGDIVEAVDGQDTLEIPLAEVIQWIRGPEETVVRLTVRSSGAESKEVEIVRRVVPFKTLDLVPQKENSVAAFIRLHRVSASTVHELRKIIGELPEVVTTVILDLRFSQDGSLHHLNLLADALLEDGVLGSLETRSGARLLHAEAGTVFEARRAVVVYNPGHSEQINWLATVLQQHEVPVYRDEYNLRERPEEAETMAQTVREFLPLRGGLHYIGITTSRLLTASGGPFDRKDPAGVLIGSTSSAPGAVLGSLEWLSNQASVADVAETLAQLRAIRVVRDDKVTMEPLPNPFEMRKRPAGDKLLIEQIMAEQ